MDHVVTDGELVDIHANPSLQWPQTFSVWPVQRSTPGEACGYRKWYSIRFGGGVFGGASPGSSASPLTHFGLNDPPSHPAPSRPAPRAAIKFTRTLAPRAAAAHPAAAIIAPARARHLHYDHAQRVARPPGAKHNGWRQFEHRTRAANPSCAACTSEW